MASTFINLEIYLPEERTEEFFQLLRNFEQTAPDQVHVNIHAFVPGFSNEKILEMLDKIMPNAFKTFLPVEKTES